MPEFTVAEVHAAATVIACSSGNTGVENSSFKLLTLENVTL